VLPASSPAAASTPGRAKRWDASGFFVSAKRLVESGDYYEAFFRLSAAGYAGSRQAARLAERLVRDGHLDAELRTIACLELGVAYEQGAQLPRDAQAAEVWLRNAARFGSREAATRLQRYAANAQAGNQPTQTSE
jgi:TPR repeat protein